MGDKTCKTLFFIKFALHSIENFFQGREKKIQLLVLSMKTNQTKSMLFSLHLLIKKFELSLQWIEVGGINIKFIQHVIQVIYISGICKK